MTCTKRTKVPDKDFPSPNRLNKLACVGSDRYLQKVPEYVKVINVCQDELDPSIVWMDFELNGVFNYTPTLYIERVDDDFTYKSRKVRAPLHLKYRRNNPKELPLNTKCKTRVFTLAFDFAAVIPEFLSSSEIEFRLEMYGVLPPSLKIPDFRKLDVRIDHLFLWKKGPTPQFINLRYYKDTGKLEFNFQFESGFPCTCNIQCKTLSGFGGGIQYCKDKRSKVVIDYVPDGNPHQYLITLKDAIGNTTNIDLTPLIDLKPQRPFLSLFKSPKRLEIGISKLSNLGADLSKYITHIQILKYQGSLSNAKVWRDWLPKDMTTMSDMDIMPYTTYGYAVLYRGKFGETSLLSDWATIET